MQIGNRNQKESLNMGDIQCRLGIENKGGIWI